MNAIVQLERLKLQNNRFCVYGGREVLLTERETTTLKVFMESRDDIVSAATIHAELQRYFRRISERHSVDVAVHDLRKKLKSIAPDISFIEGIRYYHPDVQAGYRFHPSGRRP